MMGSLICMLDYAFLSFLLFLAISIVFLQDLLTITILLSVFSVVMTLIYLLIDAPDVAMTEAAIGAVISTVVMFASISLIGKHKNNDTNNRKQIKKNCKNNVNQSFGLKSLMSNLAIISFVGIGLLYSVQDIARFGASQSPVHSNVSDYYIRGTADFMFFTNVVAAILASFRGYDTLGETSVVLIAGLSVILLLWKGDNRGVPSDYGKFSKIRDVVDDQVILQVVIKILMPMIFLYAVYVQLNGEYSPGGGFQAGAIFVAPVILLALLRGTDCISSIITISTLKILSSIGVLIYALTGVFGILFERNFLDYYIFPYKSAQKMGVFIVELGVGLTVFSTMLIIYFNFTADRKRNDLRADDG